MLEWPNCRLIVSILYLKWVFKNKKKMTIYDQCYLLYLWAYSSKNCSLSNFLCQAWTNVNNWNNVKLYFHVFIDTTWQEYIM